MSASASAGRLRWLGEPELLTAWRAEIEDAARSEAKDRRRLVGAGTAAFYKGSPLRGKHALRHAVRRALRVSEIPRLQEFHNLVWLREHGFLAPRPLLAGVFTRQGLPHFQFLVTEWLAEAPTLGEFLGSAGASDRTTVLRALATDLARLHALGFVHRDLFARNLLVVESARIAFVDAWRGGPRRGGRGPLHDLSCLFLDAALLLDAREQRDLLQTYRSASRAHGPGPPADWLARLAQGRAAVFRRESQRRRDPLPPEWVPPDLREAPDSE